MTLTSLTHSNLTAGQVEIWQIDLAVSNDRIGSCRATLSADERERADRFRFDRDRTRFIAGRAALRAILSQHLEIAPHEVEFAYAAMGKPELGPALQSSRLKFNLSHSRDVGLLAVTMQSRLGVDIEYIDPQCNTEDIAERFFSRTEAGTLRALNSADKPAAFFQCWTRKEAYIKAVGDGLSLPLDSFDVAFGPATQARLLRVQGDSDEQTRWSMYDIAAPEGFAAAMVVEAAGHRLERHQWPV
jgi:4'-phosphopantetheinyl transferase